MLNDEQIKSQLAEFSKQYQEQRQREFQAFARKCDEASDEALVQMALDVACGVTSMSHGWWPHLANEISKRGLRSQYTPTARVEDVKSGDCCGGKMIQFYGGGEVCIVPQEFTEIDELLGDTICVNHGLTDKKLPGKLRIFGDGPEATYYSRKLIPPWLRGLLDSEIKDDPATAEIRKQLWHQMRAAVTKRPRRKRDGSSRSALSSLHNAKS